MCGGRLGGGAAADRGVRPRKIGGADFAAGVLSNVVGAELRMQSTSVREDLGRGVGDGGARG